MVRVSHTFACVPLMLFIRRLKHLHFTPYLVHAVSPISSRGYFPPTASTTTIDSQSDIDAITAIAKAVPNKITAITETTLNHINAATNSVGYLNNTGALAANATYFLHRFYSCWTGKTYTTNCVPVYSATHTGYYNKYKNLISVSTLAATAGMWVLLSSHIYDN